MRRYVVAAIIGVGAVYLGMVVIGRMRFDDAGNALVRPTPGGLLGTGLPVPSTVTVSAIGVALLGAYLTK